MEIHIRLIGFFLIVLACVHIIFPKYFNWKTELQSLSLMNRQMMQIHTLFIAVAVGLMGVLCVTSAPDLVHTDLGKRVSFGIGIFWLLRLYIQFFGYSKELWKGKPFETGVHVVFGFFWTYVSVVFIGTYFVA